MRSALAQDYGELEILVSDNASSDPEVAEIGRRLARTDGRLRYVRQGRNAGHAANYQWLLEHARGTYFMWLADDDWLDSRYVSSCLKVLLDEPGTTVVCGLGRYYVDGEHVLDERPINLASRRPGVRVARYFARVSLNGPMFGIARRTDLRVTGFPPTVGGDWLLVASLTSRGRVRTIDSVCIHRSLEGMGGDPARLTRDLGVRGLAARQHHLVLAAGMWREIRAGAIAYDAPPGGRVVVASLAWCLIILRFTFADWVRRELGPGATIVERGISAWLRRRDAG